MRARRAIVSVAVNSYDFHHTAVVQLAQSDELREQIRILVIVEIELDIEAPLPAVF